MIIDVIRLWKVSWCNMIIYIAIMSHTLNALVDTQQDFAVIEHSGWHCDKYVYNKEDFEMHEAKRKKSVLHSLRQWNFSLVCWLHLRHKLPSTATDSPIFLHHSISYEANHGREQKDCKCKRLTKLPISYTSAHIGTAQKKELAWRKVSREVRLLGKSWKWSQHSIAQIGPDSIQVLIHLLHPDHSQTSLFWLWPR